MNIIILNQHHGTREGEYIGRPSPLGNPFGWTDAVDEDHRVSNREEAITAYESWIRSHLRTGTPRIVSELDRLASILLDTGSLSLRCYCAPKPCHGDVIKKVILEALQDK